VAAHSSSVSGGVMTQSREEPIVFLPERPVPRARRATGSLSALDGKLHVLRAQVQRSGAVSARLDVFDLLGESWDEIQLVGPVLPEVPLASTSTGEGDSLFMLDRSNAIGGGTVRLFRIRANGRVELLAQGYGIPQDAEVFLSVSELGRLVLAATREHPPHFGLIEIDAFGAKATSIRLYKARGALAAAPLITERGLYLLLRQKSGSFEAQELELGRLTPALGGREEQEVFRDVRR
jgi:hypothetical protein